MYVVRTYKHCAFCWPVVLADGIITFDMTITELTPICIFDMDEIAVYTLELQPPLLVRAMGGKGIQCRLTPLGCPIPLMEHHLSSGFKNLSECRLRKLINELGLKESDSEGKGDPVTELRLLLLLSREKEMTEDEALLRILPPSELEEDCGDVGILEVEDELVKDAVDQKDMDKFNAERESAKERKAQQHDSGVGTPDRRAKRICDSYKKVKPIVDPGWARIKKKGPKKPAAAALVKAKARVYEAVEKDADKALKAYKPLRGTIWTDNKNCRWRITYKGTASQRSVSWSDIGSKVGCGVALDQLWQWALEHEAIKCATRPSRQRARDSSW